MPFGLRDYDLEVAIQVSRRANFVYPRLINLHTPLFKEGKKKPSKNRRAKITQYGMSLEESFSAHTVPVPYGRQIGFSLRNRHALVGPDPI